MTTKFRTYPEPGFFNCAMGSFNTPLDVEYLDGLNWKILTPFEYFMTDNPASRLVVPKDYVTDFASVPRIFWQLLPPTGIYGKAAVIHDWVYSTELFKRSECDLIFYEAMGVLKVPQWKRWVMYRAVRTFGYTSAWMSYHTLNSVNMYRAMGGLPQLAALDRSYDYAIA